MDEETQDYLLYTAPHSHMRLPADPYYGAPFLVADASGTQHFVVIDDESGYAKIEPVSKAFADAWLAEFGGFDNELRTLKKTGPSG